MSEPVYQDEPFSDESAGITKGFLISIGDGLNDICGGKGDKLTPLSIRIETLVKLDLLSRLKQSSKADLVEQLVCAKLQTEIEQAKREAAKAEQRAAFAKLEGQPLTFIGCNFQYFRSDYRGGTADFRLEDGTTVTLTCDCPHLEHSLTELVWKTHISPEDAHGGHFDPSGCLMDCSGRLERRADGCPDDCWTFVPDDADLRTWLDTPAWEWLADPATT
jgi:hypothetical protein